MKELNSRGLFWLFLAAFLILSIYIVYQQATNSSAVALDIHVERHEQMLQGTSEFFNPWQYRVFSTYVAEAFYQVIAAVRSSTTKIEAFLLLRVLQNILIFFAAEWYFRRLSISNPFVRLCGHLLIGFAMAHAIFQSDLSFNTYFDVLFYLVAACLIIERRTSWLFVLIPIAALNRETSALIPVMLLASIRDLRDPRLKNIVLTSIIGGVLFVIVFISIRYYYGYQKAVGIHGMNSFTDFLKFNLTFKRLYLELIGTLNFLPLMVVIFLKRLPWLLRRWFWVVVPVWFAIHLAFSTAIETRLFLVPYILIFVPSFLLLIEQWYRVEPVAVTPEIR
jgi:hypothetical protein